MNLELSSPLTLPRTLRNERPDERRHAGVDLAERLVALDELLAIAAGRIDADQLTPARDLSSRVAQRLRLSSSHTVAALAGATGSGKSSMFNALAGTSLSEVGVHRPTTEVTHAVIWGAEGAGQLLDWLQIPRRHYLDLVDRPNEGDHQLDRLVLLDLPDHDSINDQHRLEVDRLVKMVDMLIWVLDPQKYADAAVHERYLRPLAGQANTMVVLLNQADRIPEHLVGVALDSVRKLLVEDGLGRIPVLATSTVVPGGIDDLRKVLIEAVTSHRTARLGIAADLEAMAADLSGFVGDPTPETLDSDALADLVAELALASGAHELAAAAAQAYQSRAGECVSPSAARCWQLLNLPLNLRRRPEPSVDPDLTPDQPRHPASSAVDRSQVDIGLRRFTDRVSAGLPDPWPETIRAGIRSQSAHLSVSLDDAINRSAREPARTPSWCLLAGALQALLVIVAGVGGVWLVGWYVLGVLQSSDVPVPMISVVPVPALMLLGGVSAGLVLAGLARTSAASIAQRQARQVEAELQQAVLEAVNELVIPPVQAELAAHEGMRSALDRLRGA